MTVETAPLLATHLVDALPDGSAKFITARDGARLRFAVWPNDGARERWCLFLNGRTEFIEKYYEVIAELMARGFGVVTWDWRGQGLSARMLKNPQKGHIDRFETYLDDADEIMAALSGELGAEPLTIVAHSMGGHLALRLAERWGDRVDTLSLSAPMTGVRLPFAKGVIRRYAGLFDRVGLGSSYVVGRGDLDPSDFDFETNLVTRDPVRFARDTSFVKQEAALRLGAPTTGWLDAAFHSIAHIMTPAFGRALKAPVLLASARADQIVDPDTHDDFMAQGVRGRLLKIGEAQHEILRERDNVRRQFWDGFDRFAV